jgi:hypothetical protein
MNKRRAQIVIAMDVIVLVVMTAVVCLALIMDVVVTQWKRAQEVYAQADHRNHWIGAKL